ncbi:MAG: outer membrane protein assembly factor BamD [Myxococcota bacterium]
MRALWLRRENVMTRSIVLILLISGIGCDATLTSQSERSALSYGRNAQEAYENALLDFRRGDCLDAEPAFRAIRREYPYSRFAALSELRVADCKFKAKSYAEAITAYRQFVRFRPSHSQVPYARFRIAESHFEQIPSEWLLSPPTHERDQRPVHEALRQLRRFVLDFPENDQLADAQRMVEKCLRVLAKHELYAARFYLRRDAYSAVVLRLRTLISTYQGSGVESEALLMLGETYIEMGDRPQARQAFQELVEQYPESDEAPEARSQLSRLGGA